MTESKNFDYEIPWNWHEEQIREKIRKNKVVSKIRTDLQKTRIKNYKSRGFHHGK